VTTLILAVVVVLVAWFGAGYVTSDDPVRDRLLSSARHAIRGLGFLVALGLVASLSFVYVDKDQTGHKDKVYGFNTLKEGAILATQGEMGPQADVLPPGFHFQPGLRIQYNVTMQDVIEIPSGRYGFLVARDGVPLRDEQTYANPFAADDADKMINNAAYFLTNGGQKGPQTTVLTPGKYRLNGFLWDVQIGDVTDIPKGFVGVVKSNVRSRVDFGNLRAERPEDCSPTADVGELEGVLSVPLVPVGCIGVWGQALNPGKYYINEKAYTVTLVDTRVQTWEYRGGFTRRQISLAVDQQGRITQREESENIQVPQHAADEAIFLKVEGWTIAQQLRVLVQVTPAHAPFVVASVGGLQEVEDRIMSPAVQSVVRNVAGGVIRVPTQVLDERGAPILDQNGEPEMRIVTRRVRVLDVIENRTALEEAIEVIIHDEGLKAGVDIKEVRLLEPDLPPELLVARKREQLAQQLAKAYHQERGAQSERIKTEQTRATADQQDKLVEAQIEVKRSEQFAMARRNEGQGERDKLMLIAEGQKSQSAILGEDRVVELRKFEFVVGRLLDFFDGNPEVLTSALTNAHKFVPERVFTLGGGEGPNSLAGAAGVLGDFLDSGAKKDDAVTR
jgi:hypothetical protein